MEIVLVRTFSHITWCHFVQARATLDACHPRSDLLLIQQRTQHPRGFLVDLHTLGQQVGRRLVTDFIEQRKDPAGCTCDRFLTLDKLPDHMLGTGHTLFLP